MSFENQDLHAAGEKLAAHMREVEARGDDPPSYEEDDFKHVLRPNQNVPPTADEQLEGTDEQN